MIAHSDSTRSPLLSVVIPAYNEENRIRPTLERISPYLSRRGLDFEIIVVDDGSTDRTVQAALTANARNTRVLRLLRNRGKGAAVRTGVLGSRGDAILISDADLATPIEDLKRLQTGLRTASVVLGSRGVPSADIRRPQSRLRRAMGRGLNRLCHGLRLCRGIRDTQCGFKLLDGPTGRDLFRQMEIDGYGFDIELIALAQHIGLPIHEVGVTWSDQDLSKVRPISDSLGTLHEMIRVRYRLQATEKWEFRSLSND